MHAVLKDCDGMAPKRSRHVHVPHPHNKCIVPIMIMRDLALQFGFELARQHVDRDIEAPASRFTNERHRCRQAEVLDADDLEFCAVRTLLKLPARNERQPAAATEATASRRRCWAPPG